MSTDFQQLQAEPTVADYIVQKRKDIILHGVRSERYAKVATAKVAKKKLSQLTLHERKAASKLPLDLLAKEWLSEQETNSDFMLSLVKNLLPTLVVGLEKLLNEVSLRSLAECMETQEDFNPINYLAQFLMRNNPLYSNTCKEHPYCKSMRQVSEEVNALAGSLWKLEELREQSKQRSKNRKQLSADRVAEEVWKVKLLKGAYAKWLVPGETSLPLAEVRSLLCNSVLFTKNGH